VLLELRCGIEVDFAGDRDHLGRVVDDLVMDGEDGCQVVV
jgi:hypothetical protein